MKLISFIPVFLISIVSVSLSAFAESVDAGEKDMASKIDDHLSKFKSYFRIHSSREHAAEEKQIEIAKAMREQSARAEAKEELASKVDNTSAEDTAPKVDAAEKEKALPNDKVPTQETNTPES